MQYNKQIINAAEELRSILQTIDRCDNEQVDTSPEEFARELVFQGMEPAEAIARASEFQAEQLGLPVESAVAEKRLEGVLESLKGHLHKFRESELNAAIKAMERAFAKWSKSNGSNFAEDQLEAVFVATTEWRQHVENIDRAAQIPVLFSSTFPYPWRAQRYEAIRGGKDGIMPKGYQGESGSAWDGLHQLANLILGEGGAH